MKEFSALLCTTWQLGVFAVALASLAIVRLEGLAFEACFPPVDLDVEHLPAQGKQALAEERGGTKLEVAAS